MNTTDFSIGEPLFLANVWYFAGWADELSPGGMVARTIAGVRVVMWADQNGEVAAFEDRCPHRMVPLSAGRNEGDGIRCAYHGMKFGKAGCLDNPHGAITGTLKPVSFPLVDRHGVLWLWLGDAERAETNEIPDFSFITAAPPHAIFKEHLPISANHQLLVDNILDLSHADFLHPDTLGGGAISAARTTMRVEGDTLVARWDMSGYPALPIFRGTMPAPDTIADSFIEVTWHPSGVMTLENGGKPAGDPLHPGYHVMTCHVMTPSGSADTHYFYGVVRNFLVDDPAFNAQMAAGFYQAFAGEDKPMAEAQQLVLGDRNIMSMAPKLMACDKAAVTARRMFDNLLEKERAQVSPARAIVAPVQEVA